MKPVKKSSPPKIVQRLNFAMDKQSLQRVAKDTPEHEDIKISFGIDYQQKIWVAAATPDHVVGPSSFAQQLSFAIPRKRVVEVLADVRSGGLVRISLGIGDDQRVWVSVSSDVDDKVASK
jgi:hypothetical protein